MKNVVVRYGVVGYSRENFDKNSAHQILDKIFTDIINIHRHETIEIVSGYTNSGIPKIAYELAEKHGLITVGFSAKQALKLKSGVYPVSKVILKGEQFGDESEEFVNYIHHLIRIGGGPQSKRETAMFKEKQLRKGSSIMHRLIENEI